MAAFSFAALDAAGKEQRGVLEADSSRQVRQLLRDRGLAPLRIEPALKPSAQRARAGAAAISIGGPSLRVAELALITRQLATLLQAAMPLEEALGAVSRQAEKQKVANIVLSVRSKVLEGHSLANSMAEYPAAFPGLYRATVAAGEHSGHLDLVLGKLADYSENAHASRQKVQLALLYPSLLLIVAIGIVAGLMTFVVPKVVDVIVGQGQELPLLTRGLIALSSFIVHWGWLALIVIAASVFAVRYALRNEELRLRWHRQLLHLPLLGRLSRGSNTARFASTLSILTSSGVPLVEALGIGGAVLSNQWLKSAVAVATQQVKEGSSLNRALEQCGYFPPMMISMIASGEMSGSLDTMLERVAASQQREFDNIIATILGIFEPMMLLVMGGAVLLIVIAILEPIFALNQLV
ncbi:MAG TPA: type II secretion system inner membrane protein GspF [Spongiibacteraceae bacterium]|nr:type II secretion system inner membrane protein GspF [Spongiibacteraceae bacterium]